MSGRVKLLYFAWLRARIGHAEEEVALPPQVHDVAGLLDWLQRRGGNYGEALRDLAVIRVAVNQDYVGPDHPIRDGDDCQIRQCGGVARLQLQHLPVELPRARKIASLMRLNCFLKQWRCRHQASRASKHGRVLVPECEAISASSLPGLCPATPERRERPRASTPGPIWMRGSSLRMTGQNLRALVFRPIAMCNAHATSIQGIREQSDGRAVVPDLSRRTSCLYWTSGDSR